MRKLFVLMAVCIALTGCYKPRVIPNGKLELIFKELFLANAYVADRRLRTDSLDIYQPMLKKYGYRPEDLSYTFEYYARRKSSSFSDVLERAIEQLNREYEHYADKVRVLDSIDRVAGDLTRMLVYSDTLLRVDRLRDTARLRIKIPVEQAKYRIDYTYRIDTTDRNSGLSVTHAVTSGADRELTGRTNWLRTGDPLPQHYDLELNVTQEGRLLTIVFGNYKKTSSEPHLTIDTLTVFRYLPRAQALDSLDNKLFGHTLLIDGKEPSRLYRPADSVALRVHPPRAYPPAAGRIP